MPNDSRPTRRLIVTADDFGASPGVNRGIIQARERGIVTSASLMVYGRAAAAAVELAREWPGLAIGLHVDVAEWEYRDEQWSATYQRVAPDDADALRAEVSSQLQLFERLVGRPPTHLDSHQHAHRSEPLRSILVDAAAARHVPVREAVTPATYCGSFYGQSARGEPYPEGITLDAFVRILDDLADGVTELGCHPADVADVDTAYAAERVAELAVLCDPRSRQALTERGIVLASFSELALA